MKMEIRKGDKVTIQVKGKEVTGKVIYAWFDEGIEEGEGYWMIELDVPGGCYWKERYDGGKVISVNGKEVGEEIEEEGKKEEVKNQEEELFEQAMKEAERRKFFDLLNIDPWYHTTLPRLLSTVQIECDLIEEQPWNYEELEMFPSELKRCRKVMQRFIDKWKVHCPRQEYPFEEE